MHSSIAHTTRPPRGRTLAETERDDLLELLRAVRDALDVPPGARRPALLDSRVQLVHDTLRDVLDGRSDLGVAWETDLLKQLAKDGHDA
ncbi:hypothetical protein ABZU94_10765 [Streptomyces mirabilis]|uniref:hypothetical protein n=1 Tax=Streptomyces sp. NPDC005388 TaxID=3156717 RepID=UPI0033B4C29F